MPKEAIFAIKNIDSRRGIINFICTNLDCRTKTGSRCSKRRGCWRAARKLLEILIRDQQLIELKNEIQEKVKQEIDKQQRDYYLQQQMRTIQDELGDGADAELDEMREKAKQKNWPKEVAELFEKELQKLERLNPAVAEYSVQVTYLQLLLELPWNDCTKDNLDLKQAREQLDHDHFGLEEVKERLLEHLAVIKLKGDLKSPILCLYGPPGVGKTSLGKSVAAALGRKFGRIALGGLHDEAEIRGHRRTYIGRCRAGSYRRSSGAARRTRSSSSTRWTRSACRTTAIRRAHCSKYSIPNRTPRSTSNYLDTSTTSRRCSSSPRPTTSAISIRRCATAWR